MIEPPDYAKFPDFFKDPAQRRRITWSYIDARDLATAARLGIERDGLGFQVMNVAADDVSSDLPTAELLARFYPGVPVRKPLGEFETLLSNAKIKSLLGFKPAHGWRGARGLVRGGSWLAPRVLWNAEITEGTAKVTEASGSIED